MLIKPEDIPGLLRQVANLISQRAARRVQREMRQTNSNKNHTPPSTSPFP